jgi:hypothetical protein
MNPGFNVQGPTFSVHGAARDRTLCTASKPSPNDPRGKTPVHSLGDTSGPGNERLREGDLMPVTQDVAEKLTGRGFESFHPTLA